MSEQESTAYREPLGHGERIRGLWRSAASGRLPHALLARGPRGIGKFAALRWLALGLHCENGPGDPCGVCGPCKRVRSGNHPDHYELDVAAGKETAIKVEHVAEREGSKGTPIEDFLRLRPSESSWRTVIVRESERMNEAAQNAFLKTLEEPAPGTVLMLETSDPGRLLATVISRVVVLSLERLAPEDARRVLVQRGLGGEQLETLVRWCGGAPGRACQILDQDLLPARSLLLRWFAGEGAGSGVLRALMELDGEFPGKTPMARTRSRVSAWIELGLELLRDLQRLQAGVPADSLAHGAELRAVDLAPSQLDQLLNRWLLAGQDVERNLGPEAALERALIRPRTVNKTKQGMSS